jgi:predicted dehydrogenase
VKETTVRQIQVGIIGTGWCGGIRAVTAAESPLVSALHIAEIREERLAEVTAQTKPVTAVTDYKALIDNPDIDAIMVSATPETTHYPMALEALQAGKHVLLEKPIALTLAEADHLIEEAQNRDLKFAIGYSQRFNVKQALVKRSFEDGTLGQPVSLLISRHITRQLGDKIAGRIKLSPAAMEGTHDIDFALWCLEPARPIRVYAQGVDRIQKPKYDVPDLMSILITMDDGTLVTICAGWVLPRGYRNYSHMWMEVVGTNGALVVDDTHRDVVMSTVDGGTVFPTSTMPGEAVLHTYAGPMERETLHFIDAVARDREVLVQASQARNAMELYLAADLSWERNEPVSLPLVADEIDQALAASVRV